MLDRLPVELLQRVLCIAAPLDFTTETYEERRALLRACCLTARRVRAVAQPMLPEVLHTFVAPGADRSLKEKTGPLVKLLVVNGSPGGVGTDEGLQRIIGLCPNVVSLMLLAVNFEATCLNQLSKLQRLALVQCRLTLPLDPPPLPSLSELSMSLQCAAIVDPGASTSLAQWLPGLRALAMIDMGWVSASLFDAVLAQQLDALIFDPVTFAYLDHSAILPPPEQVQIQSGTSSDGKSFYTALHGFPEPPPLPIYHLRLLTHTLTGPGKSANVAAEYVENFRRVCKGLQALPTLRTLELPLSYRLHVALDPTHDARRTALLQLCRDRGIEVVWSPARREHPIEPPRVSEAFWRRGERGEGAASDGEGGRVRVVADGDDARLQLPVLSSSHFR